MTQTGADLATTNLPLTHNLRIAHGCLRGSAVQKEFESNYVLSIDGKATELQWVEHWQKNRDNDLRDFRLRLPKVAFDGNDHHIRLDLVRHNTTVFDQLVGAKELHLNRFESMARVEHGTTLIGWVQSVPEPETPLRVVITEDGDKIGVVDANQPRPWVKSKYGTPPGCGFSFDLGIGYLGRDTRRFGLRIKGTSIPIVNSPFHLDFQTAARDALHDLQNSNRRSRQILWTAIQNSP